MTPQKNRALEVPSNALYARDLQNVSRNIIFGLQLTCLTTKEIFCNQSTA
jgi:hypothetical protein